MKKLFTVLATMLLVVSVAGCQKKIMASINFNDGDNVGVIRSEMNANATLKDLFDDLSKGSDFTYELDGEGYITSINGKANDELGYWNITLNGDLLNDVIANTKLNDGDECNLEYIPNTSNEIVAGWQIADIGREELTDEERQDFAKATEVLLGETYEPVCVLATQVVSGTNFAYLAKGTTVTATPVSNWVIIKVYKDLQGEVKLESISEINLMEIQSTEESSQGALGGWEVLDSGKPGSLGSEQAQASFEKALEKLVGVNYNPVQLLATQLVSGTNYIALARGKVVVPDAKPELYKITWYEDLNGESSITDIKKLDLNYYFQ